MSTDLADAVDEFSLPGIANVAAWLLGVGGEGRENDVPVPQLHITTDTDAEIPCRPPVSSDEVADGQTIDTPPLLIRLPSGSDGIYVPDHPIWRKFDPTPLPSWVQEIRPTQRDAVEQVVEAYQRGAGVVFVDAPTGSGKSLIGELVRRRVAGNPDLIAAKVVEDQTTGETREVVDQKAAYICHSKSLQAQYLADFAYARVLMGRSNYLPQVAMSGVTCADCNLDGGTQCTWCPNVGACSYRVAKAATNGARLAVVNSAYFLAEANYTRNSILSGRGFGIMDECDVLEQEVMGFAEFYVSERTLDELEIEAPKKGSHRPTIYRWFNETLIPAVERALEELPGWSEDVKVIRHKVRLTRLLEDAVRVEWRLEQELAARAEGGEGSDKAGDELVSWVRDNDAGPMTLKPVRIDDIGVRDFFSHCDKWLMMSATIVSSEQMAMDLGLDRSALTWETVEVPMAFAVENRPIYAVSLADMTFKNQGTAWPQMVEGVLGVLTRHPHENVLIHTVSYKLTEVIADAVRGTARPVVTYTSGKDREQAIGKFRQMTNGVMIAPSLDRGVDFKDDDCRVVIVAKVPFASLGDPVVSARMHSRGGKGWYACQTVRKLVQMTGRGVRSEDDWCAVYLLDSQFRKNVWSKHKSLFPAWWREAVDVVSVGARELRGGY